MERVRKGRKEGRKEGKKNRKKEKRQKDRKTENTYAFCVTARKKNGRRDGWRE